MRMWMLPPEMMCMKHIVGEHGEIHKHLHNFEKKHNLSGRISPIVQISPYLMKQRHDELVAYLKNHLNCLFHTNEDAYAFITTLDYNTDLLLHEANMAELDALWYDV